MIFGTLSFAMLTYSEHAATHTATPTRLVMRCAGSLAEWLACWTQAQKGLGSNRSRDAVR